MHVSKKQPNFSTYICFTNAVKYQNFSRRSLSCWFDILVDKEDYEQKDRNVLIGQLNNLSVLLEDYTFLSKIDDYSVLISKDVLVI